MPKGRGSRAFASLLLLAWPLASMAGNHEAEITCRHGGAPSGGTPKECADQGGALLVTGFYSFNRNTCIKLGRRSNRQLHALITPWSKAGQEPGGGDSEMENYCTKLFPDIFSLGSSSVKASPSGTSATAASGSGVSAATPAETGAKKDNGSADYRLDPEGRPIEIDASTEPDDDTDDEPGAVSSHLNDAPNTVQRSSGAAVSQGEHFTKIVLAIENEADCRRKVKIMRARDEDTFALSPLLDVGVDKFCAQFPDLGGGNAAGEASDDRYYWHRIKEGEMRDQFGDGNCRAYFKNFGEGKLCEKPGHQRILTAGEAISSTVYVSERFECKRGRPKRSPWAEKLGL